MGLFSRNIADPQPTYDLRYAQSGEIHSAGYATCRDAEQARDTACRAGERVRIGGRGVPVRPAGGLLGGIVGIIETLGL